MKDSDDITFRLVKVQGHTETNEMFWNERMQRHTHKSVSKVHSMCFQKFRQLPRAAFGTSSYYSRLVMYEWHLKQFQFQFLIFAFIICWRIFYVKFQWTIKKLLCHLSTTEKRRFHAKFKKFPQSKDRSAVDVGRGTEINVSKMTANVNHLKSKLTGGSHDQRKCKKLYSKRFTAVCPILVSFN